MILGTVVGVAQSNLKRMLAYSSIAHGGYLLVGLVAANQVGKAAILFYLLAYAVTNLAAFGVIALLGTRDRANDELRDYAGLWHTHPALAALMTVCLLSLGGLPPTAGFIGKWYIFSAAVSAGYYWLAIIGVLTSVVSVFFYLRVVVMMYMAERDAPAMPAARRAASAWRRWRSSIIAIFYLGHPADAGPELRRRIDRHDLLDRRRQVRLEPRRSRGFTLRSTYLPTCRTCLQPAKPCVRI